MKKKNKYELLILLKDLKKNKFSNNLSTLHSEKNKLDRINTELNDMMNSSSFKEGEIFSGASMQLTSKFRKNLHDKISVSKNRKHHLKKEIKTNLIEIGKINKQKEKIAEKNKEIAAIKENLEELRSENYFKSKNL